VPQNDQILPWQKGNLANWDICGMNHYKYGIKRFLFVSMVKDGKCIKAEGQDDIELWRDLYKKAQELK